MSFFHKKKSSDFSRTKVLVLRFSAIGDVVLATAALRLLLSHFKEEQIIWLGSEPSLSILRSTYKGVTYYELSKVDKKNSDFSHIDYIFDLQGSLKSWLFCFFLRFRSKGFFRFSINKKYFWRWFLLARARLLGRRFSLGFQHKKVSFFQYELMLECVNKLFKLEKEALFQYTPCLASKEKSKGSSYLKGKKFCLAVAPGASWENKKAPQEIFCKVISLFYDLLEDSMKKETLVVFLGSLEDKKTIKLLAGGINQDIPYLDLSGAFSLAELPCFLGQVNVLLTNDSGLLHVSESVKTPVAALFGPTVEAFGFKPFLKESKVFSEDLSCRPCSRHGKISCRYSDRSCFFNLNPKKIAEFIFSFFLEYRD